MSGTFSSLRSSTRLALETIRLFFSLIKMACSKQFEKSLYFIKETIPIFTFGISLAKI